MLSEIVQTRDSSDNWRNSAQKFIHRTIFLDPIGGLSGPQTPSPPKTFLGNLFSDCRQETLPTIGGIPPKSSFTRPFFSTPLGA